MISEKLAGLYTKLEDKYFDALDFLDKKGIPIYKYSDFFENRGVPSFVATMAIIVAIILIIVLALTYTGANLGELSITLRDSDGNPLANVPLKITDAQGNPLFDGTKSDGDTIKLSRALFNGDTITITAQPDGYQPASLDFTVGTGDNVPSISFDKGFSGTTAQVRVVDSETKTIISDAIVIASTSSQTYQFEADSNGTYTKAGVPAGVNLLLKVDAEGYNEYNQTVTFNEGQVREVELDPSTAGFAGTATVAVEVKDPNGNLVDLAKVTVTNTNNDVVLLTGYTQGGRVTGPVQAGVPLRVAVEKEGFLTYDSDTQGGNVTIRKNEDIIQVQLSVGGQNMHVLVTDGQSGFGLDGATAQIFDSDGTLLAAANTTATGIDFNGLDANGSLYFTAQKEGYLPTRQLVAVSTTEQVTLSLRRVTATNSARIDIYSTDQKGQSINGVKVTIYDINGSTILPYGIPVIETSFAGYVNATVETGKTYEVRGTTDVLEGKQGVIISTGDTDKKVYLRMATKANVVQIHFIDTAGNDVMGNATITGLDGSALFDGNLAMGTAFFDAQQKATVAAEVTLNDGNVFTENVNIAGKNFAEVVVYQKGSSALTPTIEFVGIEDEQGNDVMGLTPGAFYWAKFAVAFPRAATTGGVHFRTGDDTAAFAESEKIGVYDMSFQGANVLYSQSYTPSPAPGNEAVDRANTGGQGEKNKWAEGTISAPNGTYTIKVKLRTEDYTPGTVQLKYRAWATVGSDYYRAPEDTALANGAYTSTKAGLYATTQTKDFTLYESLPECKDNICITANFVDAAEKYYAEKGFEATKGNEYALEAQLTATSGDYVQVVASTDSNIDFSATQTDNFGFAVNRTAQASAKKSASAAVSLAKDSIQKLRFYFTPNSAGSAAIKITATGKSSVAKDILFNIVEDAALLVELSSTQVMPGKDFSVRVTDEGLKGVNNALIKILDKDGQVVKSIAGDNTNGRGQNGSYQIANNLAPGLYTVEVSAQKYKSQSVPLLITIQDILTFPDTLEAKIPAGQKTAALSGVLENASNFSIQSITVQVDSQEKPNTTLGQSASTTTSGKFKISTVVPPALADGQSQQVQVNVAYLGAATGSADETATLTISGLVEGRFLTKVSSVIHMTYNMKLDSKCLQVNPSSLTMSLLGSQGTTDTETLELTNNCDQALLLNFDRSKVKEKTSRSFIAITADGIDMQPGETKNLTITATNLVDRGSAQQETFGFDIVYDANYIKKTISVNVQTINPLFALSYPPQVTLWLAQSNLNEKATMAQPIVVTNLSSFPVDNLSFSISNDYLSTTSSNLKLSVEPSNATSLLPGQSIIPPKVIFAQSNSKITEPVQARIIITGTMRQLNNRAGQLDNYNYYNNYNNGLSYGGSTNPIGYYNNYNTGGGSIYSSGSNYFGNGAYPNNGLSSYYNSNNYYGNALPLSTYSPQSSPYYSNSGSQVLGIINVIAYYSGYNCLQANLESDGDSYFFPAQGTQIGKIISIVNTCAEPVRITGASPAAEVKSSYAYTIPISSSVMLSLPPITVAPGETAKVPLNIMTAVPNINRANYQIVIDGVSGISQTPINSKPFGINIYSGLDTSAEHVKAAQVNVSVCNSTGTPTKEVALMPKVQGNNCGEGYCDAVDASNYLAQKIWAVINSARSQGYTQKNSGDAFSCAKTEGACTFAQIGLTPQPFDLYLQNDSISADILQSTLNNKEMEGVNTTPFRETLASNGFWVRSETIDPLTLKPMALTGYDRTVFIDRELFGCGYYRLSITGVFKAGPDGLDTMTPVIAVKVQPINGLPRLATAQCNRGINNIVNFNPVDKGLNPGSERGTMMTTISPDLQLNDIASGIAKTRYGSEMRVAAGSGNVLQVKRGALVNAVAQLCMTGYDNKTITLTVDSAQMNAATAKDAFNQSVIKMATDALNGSFGNNCLTKVGDTYACVNLSSASTATRRLSVVGDKIQFSSNKESCVSGTVYSNTSELLNFNVVPLATIKPFIGVKKITISTDDTKAVPLAAVAANAATTTNAPSATGAPTTKTSTPSSPMSGTTPTGANPAGAPSNGANNGTAPANNGTNPAGQNTLETGVLYSYEILGGNLEPSVTANNPISLKKNISTNSYLYYRNVKICATPNDVASGVTAPETAYIQANGVQFAVSISNPLHGESNAATKDSAQTLTIQTGTLHPEDLAMKLCKKEGIDKTGSDNPYYFTLSWAQGPESPSSFVYSQYMDGLKNSGKLDSCIIGTTQTGPRGTAAYENAYKSARGSALMGYISSCSMASAACNTAITGFGGVISPIYDCLIPGMITYREDLAASSSLAKSFYTYVDGWVKKIPAIGNLISGLLTSIKSDAPTPKNYATAGLVDAGIGATAKTMLISSAKARILSGISDGTIDGAANQTGKLMADNMRNELAKMVYGSPAAIPAVGTPERTAIEDIVAQVNTDAAKRVKDGMTAIQKDMFAKVSIPKRVANIGSQYASTDAATTFQDAYKASLDGIDEVYANALNTKVNGVTKLQKLLDPTGKLTTSQLQKKIADTGLQKFIQGIGAQPNDAFTSALKTRLGMNSKLVMNGEFYYPTGSAADKASLRAIIKNSLTDAGITGTKTSDVTKIMKSLESASGRPIDTVADFVSMQVRNTIGTALAADDAAKIGAKFAETASKQSAEQLGKDIAKATTASRNWTKAINVTKGLGCSVLANVVGVGVYNSYLTTAQKKLNNQSMDSTNPDFTFENGKTYKMVLNQLAGYKIQFTQVDDAAATQMEQDIASKKATKMVSAPTADGKTAGERPLDVWLLKTTLTTAKDLVNKWNYPYSDAIAQQHLNILQNPDVEKLVYLYTSDKTIEGKTNSFKIDGADEGLVLSIMLLPPNWKKFDAQIDSEIKNRSGWLRASVESAVALERSTGKPLDSAAAKQLFKGISNDDAAAFVQMLGTWQALASGGYSTNTKPTTAS